MNSTSSQPNFFFFYAIVILKGNQSEGKESDEKVLLVVNPSSGGEQAKEFEQLGDSNWNRCLMKWSSCIQKQGMQKPLLISGYGRVSQCVCHGRRWNSQRRNQWNR